MIAASLLHALKHESANICRPKALQTQSLCLESLRQKLPGYWQAMADGDWAERSFLRQMPGVTLHHKFDWIVQSLIRFHGDDVGITKSAEQKPTRSPLTMMRAKPSAAVCSEGVDLIFIELPKAEAIGRKPFV
jgi:hypothetical protein